MQVRSSDRFVAIAAPRSFPPPLPLDVDRCCVVTKSKSWLLPLVPTVNHVAGDSQKTICCRASDSCCCTCCCCCCWRPRAGVVRVLAVGKKPRCCCRWCGVYMLSTMPCVPPPPPAEPWHHSYAAIRVLRLRKQENTEE